MARKIKPLVRPKCYMDVGHCKGHIDLWWWMPGKGIIIKDYKWSGDLYDQGHAEFGEEFTFIFSGRIDHTRKRISFARNYIAKDFSLTRQRAVWRTLKNQYPGYELLDFCDEVDEDTKQVEEYQDIYGRKIT